jgi:hypothetical protein
LIDHLKNDSFGEIVDAVYAFEKNNPDFEKKKPVTRT